jgi:TolA-binding protein
MQQKNSSKYRCKSKSIFILGCVSDQDTYYKNYKNLFNLPFRQIIICLCLLISNHNTYAGIFSDSEARKAIVDLKQQISEQTQEQNTQYKQIQTGILDLQNHIENLRNERNKLNGQIDVINSELAKSKQNYQLLANTYSDKLNAQQQTIDELKNLLTATTIKNNNANNLSAPTSVSSSGSVNGNINTSEDNTSNNVNSDNNNKIKRIFNAGLKYFNQGDFKKSADIFNELLADNTDSVLMPLVTYYLASSYYGLQKHKQAIIQLRNFILNYPTDEKIPDVYLMLANIYFEINDKLNAKQNLEHIINNYPKHAVFPIAKKRLAEIKK